MPPLQIKMNGNITDINGKKEIRLGYYIEGGKKNTMG